jgi:nucleolar complex protein 3
VKETNRLHNLSKSKEPLPRKRKASPVGSVATVSTLDEQDLSDFDSDIEMNTTDAEGSGSDGSGSDESDSELKAGYDFVSESDSEAEDVQRRSKKKAQREDGAEEADYETRARARWQKPKETEDDTVEVSHLPIKLPSGEIQHVKGTTKLPAPAKKPVKPESDSEEEDEEEDEDEESGDEVNKMASVKGRFGRLGVADIVAGPPYKTREKLAIAKEQIARVGAEILAGGELIDNVSGLEARIDGADSLRPHC